MRREVSPPALSVLVASSWLPLMFILTVNSSCKGCFQGWMSRSTQALGSLPGLSLLELISASAPAKADVLKVLPCERSTFSCS